MEAAAVELGSRFVLSVGDNFYPDGVASVTDPHWKLSYEDIYAGPHLQTPWYVALGNHDYHDEPQAQLDYARTSPRWRMPARYYKVAGSSLGYPDLDMFCIDTTPMMAEFTERRVRHSGQSVDQQNTDRQLAWLDRELAASTAPWKLVFGHHTIRSGGSGHGDTPEMVEKVLPILQRHKVQAYVCGHDHDLQHIARDGLNYVLTGAGSEVRPVRAVAGTTFCAAVSGFTAFRLSRDALDIAFRDHTGATLHSTRILRT
jgi:acid phosphatase